MNENFLAFCKVKKHIISMILFCVLSLAVILIAIIALNEPVVPVCILVIVEAALAGLMHEIELWLHGLLVLAQVIAGILTHNIWLIILCVALYIAATYTLIVLLSGERE